MDYHWSMMTEEERRDAVRDMGVALGWAARSMRSSPRSREDGRDARPTASRDGPP